MPNSISSLWNIPVMTHHSEIPSSKTKISQVVEGILNPKKYTIVKWDNIAKVEAALWIVGLWQNLLLWINGLENQTISYNGQNIILPSGTSFPVRAANDELYALAA
jgi:hypothetical protein